MWGKKGRGVLQQTMRIRLKCVIYVICVRHSLLYVLSALVQRNCLCKGKKTVIDCCCEEQLCTSFCFANLAHKAILNYLSYHTVYHCLTLRAVFIYRKLFLVYFSVFILDKYSWKCTLPEIGSFRHIIPLKIDVLFLQVSSIKVGHRQNQPIVSVKKMLVLLESQSSILYI